MKLSALPTAWKNLLGKQVIILFGGDRKPVVVHIKGVGKYGDLIAPALNSGETYFPSPLRCIEYSPRLFAQLLVQSKYRCAKGEAQIQLDKLKERVALKHNHVT